MEINPGHPIYCDPYASWKNVNVRRNGDTTTAHVLGSLQPISHFNVDKPSDNEKTNERLHSFKVYAKALEAEISYKYKKIEKDQSHPIYMNEYEKFKKGDKRRLGISYYEMKQQWYSFWAIRIKELGDQEKWKRLKNYQILLGLPDSKETDYYVPRNYSYRNSTKWDSAHKINDNISKGGTNDSRSHREITEGRYSGRLHRHPYKKNDIVNERKSSRSASTGKSSPEPARSDSKHRKADSNQTIETNGNENHNTTEKQNLLSILRLLSAIEDQLGSSAKRVNELLMKAIGLEKIEKDGSNDLLISENNINFLEVIKHKLLGQLLAETVPKNRVSCTKEVIKALGEIPKIANNSETQVFARLGSMFPEPEEDETEDCNIPFGDDARMVLDSEVGLMTIKVIDVAAEAQAPVNEFKHVKQDEKEKTTELEIEPKDVNEVIEDIIITSPDSENQNELENVDKTDTDETPRSASPLNEIDLKVLLENYDKLTPSEQQFLLPHLINSRKTGDPSAATNESN